MTPRVMRALSCHLRQEVKSSFFAAVVSEALDGPRWGHVAGLEFRKPAEDLSSRLLPVA